MIKILFPILILSLLLIFVLFNYADATVVFSSKWASTTTGGAGTENDGGNWYLAEPGQSGVSILRVSGNESSVGNGGPSGLPAGSNATHYLRITKHNTDDNMLYLQTASENSATEYSDLYMGAWWYFESGFQFRDSVKFMDFRGNLSKLATGNGHLQLFGFTHEGWYAGSNYYANGGWTNGLPAWGSGVHQGSFTYLTTWRYLAGAGQDVRDNEENFNFYDVSPQFDSNLNSSEAVIPQNGYNSANVNRVQFAGGKWIAVIVHAKISTTDGVLEMWIKDGGNPLKKVMQWDRNTVWSSGGTSPNNFYTANGTAGINHCEFDAYWNGGTSYPAVQYMWLANPVVATTYDDVANYLGVSSVPPDTTPPTAPSGVTII